MIPIITPETMSLLEKEAYKQGASEKAFMAEAGLGIAKVVKHFITKKNLRDRILLIVGKGNNGGDALAAGTYLLKWGFHVTAWLIFDAISPLAKEHLITFQNAGGALRKDESLDPFDLILDGLFGTGFKGTVRESALNIIHTINAAKKPVIAIDIPSGLNGKTGKNEPVAIQATATCYLGFPKIGFFQEDGWDSVGELVPIDFGLPLHPTQIEATLLNAHELSPFLPFHPRHQHKYEAGVVVGVAGSPHYTGAALLAAESALRSGTGLVRLLHPAGIESLLVNSPLELIKMPYRSVDDIIPSLERATALFIGPGLEENEQFLTSLLTKTSLPMVIDAGALLPHLPYPKNSILTPHPGEMIRLLNLNTIPNNLHERCQQFVDNKGCILILKGGPTWIFSPHKPPQINPTGNSGMATAGSGDVLTGLIASLLSQGLSPNQAAPLAVYLHGLAGDITASFLTPYFLNASDLIASFPEAFKQLKNI